MTNTQGFALFLASYTLYVYGVLVPLAYAAREIVLRVTGWMAR